MKNHGKLFVVEGNICSGKTTLVKKLKADLGNNCVVFIEPSLNNPYLDKFYKDPKKYALTMQIYMLNVRFKNYVAALELVKSGKTVILDRSIFSDIVFAEQNFNDGNISKDGYKYYLNIRSSLMKRLPIPTLFINLNVCAKVCHDRILRLRCIECEKTIPLTYLNGLDMCYKTLFRYLRGVANVVDTDWDKFDNYNDIYNAITSAKKTDMSYDKKWTFIDYTFRELYFD